MQFSKALFEILTTLPKSTGPLNFDAENALDPILETFLNVILPSMTQFETEFDSKKSTFVNINDVLMLTLSKALLLIVCTLIKFKSMDIFEEENARDPMMLTFLIYNGS